MAAAELAQRPITVKLRGLVTLGGAVLVDQLARPPLGDLAVEAETEVGIFSPVQSI